MRNLVLFILSCSLVFGSYQKGLDEFRLHRYKDAHDSFLNALKNKEMPGESAYYLGKIFLMGQEMKKAYKYFLMAFKYESQNNELSRDFQTCVEELRNALPFDEFHELYTQAYQKGIYPIPCVYYRVKNLQNRLDFSEILATYEVVKDAPSFQIGKRFYGDSLAFIQYYAALGYVKVADNTIKAIEAAKLSIKADSNLTIARKLLQTLQTKQATELNGFLTPARKKFIDRDFDSSEELFMKAFAVDPQSQEAKQGIEKSRLAKQSFVSLDEAKKLYAEARFELALKKLKFATTAYPDNFEAVNLREEIKGKIQEKLNIQQQQDETEKNEEREYLSLMSEGSNYINGNEFQRAIDSFSKALKIKPDSTKAQSGLELSKAKFQVYNVFQEGLKSLEKGDFSNAIKSLEEVQRKEVSFEGLASAIIEAHYLAENYEKVIQLSTERLKLVPNDTHIMYFLGRSYEATISVEESRLNDALRTYSNIASIKSPYLDTDDRRRKLLKLKYAPMAGILVAVLLILFIFGWLYKTRGVRKSNKFANAVHEAANAKDYKQLAIIYDDLNSVALPFDETLRTLPTFMHALVEVGRYDEALKIGPKVLGSMPQHQQVLLLMARAYFELKIFNPGVMKYYESLFNSDQLTDEIVDWVGHRIVNQDMDNEKTLPVIWKYFDLHPENDKCRKILLKHLKEEDSISRRLVDMMEAEIKYNPRDVNCRLKLAEYHLERQQFETSIRYCEEVINLNPTERKLHEILYEAYAKQDNLLALEPIYNSLLGLYPNNIVLQETQNKIRLTTGQKRLSQPELDSMRNQNAQ